MAGKKYEVYVHKGRPIYKIITGILFSHAGLFVLAIGYGALGAWVFIQLELGAEEIRYEEKLNKTKDVDAAVGYLKNIFYFYATNVERYNYTRYEFQDFWPLYFDVFSECVMNYYGILFKSAF